MYKVGRQEGVSPAGLGCLKDAAFIRMFRRAVRGSKAQETRSGLCVERIPRVKKGIY